MYPHLCTHIGQHVPWCWACHIWYPKPNVPFQPCPLNDRSVNGIFLSSFCLLCKKSSMFSEICAAAPCPLIRFYLLDVSGSLPTYVQRTCVWHCVTLHCIVASWVRWCVCLSSMIDDSNSQRSGNYKLHVVALWQTNHVSMVHNTFHTMPAGIWLFYQVNVPGKLHCSSPLTQKFYTQHTGCTKYENEKQIVRMVAGSCVAVEENPPKSRLKFCVFTLTCVHKSQLCLYHKRYISAGL